VFGTLIASQPRKQQSHGAQMVSLFIHASIVTAAVLATTQTDVFVEPTETRVFPISAPRPLNPQSASPAQQTRAPVTPTTAPQLPNVPVEVPVAPIEVPIGIPTEAPAAPTSGGGIVDPNALPSAGTGTPIGLPSGDGAFEADAVDVPVRMRANSPLPRYPDILRQSRVPGFVRVRFVVGADGRAEMNTVEIVEQSHAAFGQSVRNVLPRLRFTPAKVGTRNVRQMVEIPFGFELR
jgi:TonB family protein